jgi:hypothetical protein
MCCGTTNVTAPVVIKGDRWYLGMERSRWATTDRVRPALLITGGSGGDAHKQTVHTLRLLLMLPVPTTVR